MRRARSGGQRERKLQKKLSKAAAPAAGAPQDAVPREELFRRIEAQETVEEHRPSEAHVFAAAERAFEAEVESHHDETTSVASLTTTALLEGRRVTRFDETSNLEPDLEVVNEEESGRKALQDVFADEPWRLLLSDDAFGEVKQLGSTQQKVVLEVLKTLASGTWPEPWKEDAGSHKENKLRCAPGELNVLWGIDMEYSREQKAFTEVIQIWHVVRPEQIQSKADTVLQQWRATSRRFEGVKKALRNQPLQKKGETRYPRTVAESELQDSDVFSVRKFFTLDQQMLRSITMEDEHAGAAEEQFALRVSKREATVIEKKGPAIVIGRSGSGKTLCCVYRMFFQHSAYSKKSAKADGAALLPTGNGNEFVHLHQVFVTHSASLANKVLEYFSNLQAQEAHEKAGLQTKLLEQTRLPDTLKGLKTFPLFLTFRKFIIMVDGSLENRFFPRRHTGQLHPDKVLMAEAPDALDPISALREHHRTAQRAQAVNQAKASSENQRKTEVDYELFKSKFWPKISPHAPRECDASLLWREIQSFIKGSYKVMDTEEGHLSLALYEEVAKKASPGFEDHRRQIYKAFEAYEQLRKEWNCFDRMDVSFHVLKELKKRPYTGPPIHSVAVDEVQDLAQIELAIFFMIMKKPYEELFITGDTSQTVSRAVDFRFCDLRSLFHHFEVAVPELDQLIINYRSHQKILALSHKGVVRLLELAFPHAIDKLQPDEGHRDGQKPVVVDDVPLEDLAQHVFNLDGCSAGIAFGASQVILVRNEESRARLPPALRNCLVLTVEEAKGLEFDDCILVNFFRDSNYKEWQTVKIFLQELLNEDSKDSESKRPRFDRLRHTLLCSELKHLYTAMTRTKHVLLIIEEDKEQADHMFELWKKMDLVNFGLMQEENAEARRLIHEHAGKNRGKDSWCNMGYNLMKRQLYRQAQSAFQRGEDENMAKICEAYILAQEAARTMEEQEAEGVRLFQEAAELFGQRGAQEEQAQCLLQGQRPLQAAKIFEELGDKIKAAQAYVVAGQYRKAAKLYEEAQHVREAVENFLQADDVDNVKRLVSEAHSNDTLSTEECFRYLQDTDAHDVAGELFFKEGNYEQAASCFQSAGLLQEEAKCYLELGQPLLAANRLSASEDSGELLQAANLYSELQEEAKEVKCCRAILEMQRIDENDLMLERCIRLHQRLEEWRSAAQLLEKTDVAQNWATAVTYYEKVKCFEEAGRVCERLAPKDMDGNPNVNNPWLHKALQLYREGGHTANQLRVLEHLGQWQECGQLARKLKDFTRAAEFFLKVGDFKAAVESRLDAKDFGGAHSLLKSTGFPKSAGIAEMKLEIRCLEGLQKYSEAARIYMKILPEGAERAKMALKAFELAMKCRETSKDFFTEFSHEMPDAKIALQYFLEVADAEQICEQLMKLEKHLAAVAAASILGEPLKAIQLLDQKRVQDRDWWVLEILLVATKQNLGRDKLLPLLDHVNDLWERAQELEDIAYLDYVDSVISRRCGRKQGKSELRKSWTQAQGKLQEVDSLAFCQELALHGSEKDLTWTLQQLDWYIEEVLRMSWYKQTGKGVKESKEIRSLLERYYQATPDLHQVFYETLKWLELPVLDQKKVIPRCHRLAAKCQEVTGFSGVVQLDPSAILLDLEECRLELLQKLDSLCKKAEDFCKPPGLWLRAMAAAEERKVDFKDGFHSSLRAWASRGKGYLSQEVKQMIPEAVKDLWQKARQDAERILRNKRTTSKEFKDVAQTLQRIIKEMVTLLREAGSYKESIAQSLSDLVLEGLKVLMPICPEHVTQECKARDKCPLDHPDVGKTHEARQLLNSKKGSPKPIFDGLGLHAWLQLVNVCSKKVRTGECTSSHCQWLHPEDRMLQTMQDALREKQGQLSYYGLKFNFKHLHDLETVAQALHDDKCKIPQGFGCCFFKDEEMMLNVRLVTILASAMFQESYGDLGLDACREVLKRMCRSLYRYPDPEAAELAKKTLQEIRNLKMLQKLSHDITWEVDGAGEVDNERCLLSLLLGRDEKQKPEKRRVPAPVGATFTFNPNAAEFQPMASIYQSDPTQPAPAPARRVWEGNAARDLSWQQKQQKNIDQILGEAVQGAASRQPIGGTGEAAWRPSMSNSSSARR